MENNWITIKNLKKCRNVPKEIQIDKNGKVFIDGELYDEKKSKYKNMGVSVENHKRVNTGEETRKMIEKQNRSKKGETVSISDVKTPNKTESTTIKY